jgi:hypothetical protein
VQVRALKRKAAVFGSGDQSEGSTEGEGEIDADQRNVEDGAKKTRRDGQRAAPQASAVQCCFSVKTS